MRRFVRPQTHRKSPCCLTHDKQQGLIFVFLGGMCNSAAVCQPISAARAWSMSFCSVSACFFSVIAPTMGSPTILPLRSTT